MFRTISALLTVGQLAVLCLNPLSGQTFGTKDGPKLPSQRKGFYLNVQSPAPEDGLLTAWHYCYHDGNHLYAKEKSYTAAVMLYRWLEELRVYSLVPESKVLLSVFRPFNQSTERFKCNTTASNILVKKGDIIGTCITAPDGLYLLSEGSPDHYLYTVANTSNQCLLPMNIDIKKNSSNIHVINGTVLHVTADISFESGAPSRAAKIAPPGSSDNAGLHLPMGTIAGIVAAVVLAVALTSIAVILVAVCLVCHKTAPSDELNKSKVASENEYGENTVDGAQATVKSKLEALEYEIALNSIESKGNGCVVDSRNNSSTCVHERPTQRYEKSLESYYSTPTLLTLEKAQKHTSCHSEEQAPYYTPANDEENLCLQLEKQGIKIISSDEIMYTSFLGSGQFGSVHKATWKGCKGTTEVAVKTIKEASTQDRIKFLQEAAIMGQFKHPNIVKLHGIVTAGELMLVVEYISRGDLKTYLMSMNTCKQRVGFQVTNRLLLSFAQQIALGMNYLARKGFVHRDLAARNILVSEKNVCKIADFGLSRDLQDENCYISHGGKIPVKWTAPEAICFNKYSTASDIWSFGCVLYELWSLGEVPFSGYDNRKVVEALKTGYRLSPPTGCPRAIYDQMMKCWHPEPESRPSFTMLLMSLLEYEKHIRTVQTDEDIIYKQKEGLSSSENEYLELQQWYAN